MSFSLLRLCIAVALLLPLSGPLSAQSGYSTGLNGTVINLPCNQTCITQPFRIPHIKTSSEFRVSTIPFNPFPFTTPTGNEAPATVYADDHYSPAAALPFSVCFYDSLFNQFVYGSNGLITFDIANADCFNAWPITTPIFNAGGTICNQTGQYYPKASIMGAYSDLDPRFIASPTDRKIEWRIEGVAPYRRLVVSYFHIGVFGNTCGQTTPNTFQIVLYESSGIIEEYIQQKACNSTSSGGRAILGVQNWNRDKAEAPPGKNNAVWNETNTAYRFMPSGPISRFVSCQLLDMTGAILVNGDTTTTTTGLLDVAFTNFCPTGNSTQYVIKSVFEGCDIPGNQVITLDTITVNRTTNLNATAAVTPTSCGVTGTGTATITVPAGVGAPPYTYVLNPGNISQTTNQFTGLTVGNYTVVVTDAGGVCNSTVPVVITTTGTLAVTYSVVNTTCVGASNGSITVNPPNGTPPITYSINGGAFTANNIFSNLAPGTYFISTHDNAGCVKDFEQVTVGAGPALTLTATSTPSSCPGASNGSITITSINGGGTPPYQYSINGGPYQASNTFTGLQGSASPYFISVADATGCTITFAPVVVPIGPGTVTGNAAGTAPSCTGATNGSITVTPTSGSGPYEYSLNGGPYQVSNIFNGLAPGNYTVTIREAGLCTSAAIPVTVGPGAALLANATSATTSCNGAADGTITVTPTNGSAPYQYSLDGGAPQASSIFTGVAAGNHNVVVRDGAGCISAAIPVTVTAGPALTGTAIFTPTSCPGVNNGTITATPTNGTGPYQYSLDGGAPQASSIFAGVAAGPHTVTIRNTSGCISQPIAVNVTAGSGLTATVTPAATSCTGINNGSIVVTPTNGTGPYTFVLDGTTTQTGATATTFNGVAAGPHTITITDAIGCVTAAALPTTVATGTGFTAAFTTTNTSCSGATNGSITVTPGAGGTGPYTFVLDGTVTQTGATNTTFNNVAAGPHIILVTDANGCQFPINNATVNPGSTLTANITPTATSCTGINNGTIAVTPTNGTGPYTFVLDGTVTQTGATTTTFTGLTAGPHTITITDAIGCITTAPLPATVTIGTGFTAAFTTTSTSCSGATNGSITVTPGAGGTGPYTFVLDGTVTQTGATNTTFNNLAAGPHTILVTDANGCQFPINNATVNQGSTLTANITPTATSCTGINNGTIAVTPTNGTGPYTFVLDGTVTQTGATTIFTGLTAGPHTITITDAIGCITTAPLPATVATGTGFTAAFTTTNTSCSGAANGSITVTPGAGGTGPYTFVLDGTTTQNGAANTIFNNVAAGPHTILVTDANGCQFPVNNATVNPGAPLAATTTPTATACPGINNGSILVTPTNGNGPYTFVLDGTVTQTGAISTTFIGLAAGAHTIVVTDVNGCSSTLPAVNVVSGSSLTANINPTSTSCIGAVNGSIAVAPTSGSGPYTFVLNGTTTQNGATTTFANLAAGGAYSILITDAIGCTGTFNNINVPQGSALTANTVPVATSCNGGNNGQITVTPNNGAGPYTFVLNGTITQTGATNTIFTGLLANAYNIVVTDAAGCQSSPIPVTVNAGPAITVSLAKTDATCFGSATGTITATPSANATAPVQYSLDNVNWQASPNFTGLAANTYTVYINDGVGCVNSTNITVGQPAQLQATTSAQAALCNGSNNGLIVVSATGGAAGYSYSLDNINFQPGNSFNVPAGTYTVFVRDANNCTTQINNVNITQPAVLTATTATSNSSCAGGNDGGITVTVAGGTSAYQYSVDGVSFQSSNVLNVGPGTYTVTVRDINGCTAQVAGVVVGLTNNLTLTPAPDPAPICEGSSVQLRVVTNATQFSWTPATRLSDASIANPVASPTTTTLYTVTARLGNCSVTDDILVSVIPAPIPNAGPDGDICYGQSYQLQGSGGATYEWTPSTYLSSQALFDPQVVPDKTITYTLSVKDANGCSSLVTDQVTVKVTPPIEVIVTPADTVVIAGAQIPLLAVSAGTNYTWSPATGLNNPNIANPITTAPLIEGSVVVYEVTSSTSAGCVGKGTVRVQVYKGPDIYVVTGFTPNGDGRNETFIPFPVGIKQLNYFRVFNRWGQMIFSTTTLNKGWDGRFGGIEQPSGAYVWMVEAVTQDNKVISKRGTVMLIR